MKMRISARFGGASWLAVAAVGFLAGGAFAQTGGVTARELDQGWEFRSVEGAKEIPVTAVAARDWKAATVPGVVQTDLLANNIIPDPFYGQNEASSQWIGRTVWEYRTTFDVSAAELRHRHVELVFDGLDTFADVSLNGTAVLKTDNMFRQWRVSARQWLKPGKNELKIIFHSPITLMLPVVKAMAIHLPTVGQVQAISEDEVAVDPYVRKAPYQFGWDWGPRFVTEGIWKPVRLETWDDVRVEDFHLQQKNITAQTAELAGELTFLAEHAGTARVTVSYRMADSAKGSAGRIAVSETVPVDAGENHIWLPFRVARPERWYPLHYGAQARYDFSVNIAMGGKNVASVTTRTGLRSVELRRQPDAWGKSFEFVVNGIPVFAKGADVIPFDSFPDRVTPARHRQILEAARDANMNMIREWGGGYYETDDFYDTADELGIMVWQEFAFGGAMVPGDPEFRENVKQEAEEQVRRLRNHPSIVLWCGNNEVETGWKYWGDRQTFKKSLTAEQQQDVWQAYLLLFNDTLKSVVEQKAKPIAYWPSSPSANYEGVPGGQRNGDMHYWEVWHGLAPIEDYDKQNPRFMSEFGFQSFPAMQTIESFAGPAELSIDSPTMQAHQKDVGGNDRIHTYMLRQYREPKDFASLVYMSQVLQAEAIKTGAEHLRRDRPRTMGALYWQLNDCWPVASWSSIDYYGRWKALQYYARRFYSDVLISPYLHDGVVETYVVSDAIKPQAMELSVRVMKFDGTVVGSEAKEITVKPLSSTLLSTEKQQALLRGADATGTFAVYELTAGGAPVSRNLTYFAAAKDEALPRPVIQSDLRTDGKDVVVTLKSDVLARDVYISFGELETKSSDNYFDLLPGETKEIRVSGSGGLEALRAKMTTVSLVDAYSTAQAAADAGTAGTAGR
jgi:beta-mannosidase